VANPVRPVTPKQAPSFSPRPTGVVCSRCGGEIIAMNPVIAGMDLSKVTGVLCSECHRLQRLKWENAQAGGQGKR
jgi:hypothetical protein